MRKRFNLLPTYHFEENTDGQIRGAAERVLRDCTIYGNCGKNLIPYPYGQTTEVRNGVTFTDNGDGTITVNGTATSNTYFIFNDKLKNIIDISKKYILSGSSGIPVYIALYQDNIWKKAINSTNGKPAILDFPNYTNIEYNRILVATYVPSGKTVNNAIVKPMLELGETATDYEPYKEVGDSDAESGKYILPVTVSGKNVFNWDAVSTVQDVIAPNTSSLIILDNGAIIKGLSNPTQNLAVAYSNGWFRPGAPYDTHNRGNFYVKKGCSVQITADVRLIELSENYTDNNYTNIYLYGTESHTSGNSSVTLPTDGTVKRVSATHEVKTSGMYYPVFTLNSNTLEIMNIQCTIKHTDGTWDSEDYEPYTAPKTTNLLLDAPLGPGESISCREKGLLVPELATIDPNITNYIAFGSEVKPSSAKYDYYKY